MADVIENTPTNIGPVVREVLFFQQFVALGDHLAGLSLLFGTYGQAARCRVRLSVLDASRENVLRVVEADAEDIADNVWHRFDFEVIEESQGKTFWIQFETSAVAPEHAPTLWTNASVLDVYLRDGRPGDAAICHLTHYVSEQVGVSENLPTNVGPISNDEVFEQRFVALGDHLAGLSLLFGTYGRTVRCRVRLSVLDASRENVLRVVEADAEDIADNAWHRFYFEVIEESRDTTFWIRFALNVVPAEHALTLWANANVRDVYLRDGRPGDAAVCLLTHYVFERVGDATEGVTLALSSDEDRLRQRFVSARNYLEGVALYVGDPDVDSGGELLMSVWDATRTSVVREVRVDSRRLRAGRWEEFRFAPIADSARQMYWIELERSGAPKFRNTFLADAHSHGDCLLNDAPTDRMLCFKPLYGRKAKGSSDLAFCCVTCSAPVEFERSEDALRCPACGARFPLVDGAIPVFLDDPDATSNRYGDLFRAEADDYNVTFNADPSHGEHMLRRLIELVPNLKRYEGGAWLEIGAGAGHLTGALASGELLSYEKLYVSDLSAEMLTANYRARREDERAGRVQFMVSNVLNLPFPDASIDGVIGCDVLHHVLDYPAGLRELSRILKPHGVCILREPYREPYRLLRLIIRMLLRMDGLTPEDRLLVESWEQCLLQMFVLADAGRHDELAAIDDKYCFDRDELRREARDVGFLGYSERSDFARPRPSVRRHGDYYASILVQIFSLLGVSETGMRLVREVCADIDATFGDQLLADYPPNLFFILEKEE